MITAGLRGFLDLAASGLARTSLRFRARGACLGRQCATTNSPLIIAADLAVTLPLMGQTIVDPKHQPSLYSAELNTQQLVGFHRTTHPAENVFFNTYILTHRRSPWPYSTERRGHSKIHHKHATCPSFSQFLYNTKYSRPHNPPTAPHNIFPQPSIAIARSHGNNIEAQT
jgi:hypothetical protein